jgi:prepilin peptidase CpaA
LNLIHAAPLWLLIVLACAMIAAAAEDAARLRISNLTVLVVLLGAIAAALIAGPSWGLWQNLAVFVIILALGTAAFSARWLGGGDVKLFAAAALWFDFSSALTFVVLVLLSGGVVAAGYVLARPFRPVPAGGKWARRIPYGIAIAVGAIAMILLSPGTFGRHERPSPASKYIPLGG